MATAFSFESKATISPQVQFGYGATEEESLEKLKYDLYYIKNSNLLLDLWIVLKTVKVVLFGKGAR